MSAAFLTRAGFDKEECSLYVKTHCTVRPVPVRFGSVWFQFQRFGSKIGFQFRQKGPKNKKNEWRYRELCTTPSASRNIESISIRQIPSSRDFRPGSASLTVTLGDEVARVCKSLKQNPKRSLEVGGTSARSRSLVHDRGHALLAAFAGEAAVATWIAIVKTTLRIQ